MLEDLHIETQTLRNKGTPNSKMHYLVPVHRPYVNSLSRLADIKNLPTVLDDLSNEIGAGAAQKQLQEYRNFKYIVLDDHTYIKERCNNSLT